MSKHALNGIVAAMLPLGLTAASGQALGAYTYLGSRQNKSASAIVYNRPSNQAGPALTGDRSLQTISQLRRGVETTINPSQLTIKKNHATEKPSGRAARNVQLQIVKHEQAQELMIVDGAVPDKALFYKDLKANVDVVELAPGQNGLAQLTDILSRYKNLKALHIVSHADAGVVYLGNSKITEASLRAEIDILSELDNSLNDGADLLFYGCNLASGQAGKGFLELISHSTNLDVAASSNDTGASNRGGDWDLEISTGNIETEQPFSIAALRDYTSLLVVADGAKNFAGWAGSGGATLSTTDFDMTAHDGAGAETIQLSGTSAYMQENAAGATNGYFYVQADGAQTATFELTGLVMSEYGGDRTTSDLYIIGNVSGGGTVTSSTLNGTGGQDTFTFGAGQLGTFSGVALTGFKVYFDTVGTADYTNFDSFTVANGAGPNGAPTNITLTSSTIAQSATSLGADIGTLDATDADDSSFTFTLVSNGTAANGACGGGKDADNASFQVNTATFETAGALAAGSYDVCLQANDGTTTFEKTHSITVTDDVPPVYENSTPSLSGVTNSGATINVQLDEIGTAYWVVVADGAGAPSVGQVKLGQDSGGGGAIDSGNFAIGTASTNLTDTLAGLTGLTAYDVYVVSQDDEGSPNVQASVTGPVNLTTLSTSPAISIAAGNLAYTENAAVTQVDSAGTLSDADGDAEWDGGTLTVQISANADAGDELSIPDNVVGTINTSGTDILDGGTVIGTLSDAEGTVTNNSTLTITFDSDATNALVQEVVQSIHYRSTVEDPGTSNRTVTFTATDKNASSANDARVIALTATNDEPTLTATGSDPTFTEGGGAAGVFSAASASTIESADTLAGMTLTVTNVNDGADEVLSFDGSSIQLTHLFNVPVTATNSLDVSVSVAATTATVSFTGESLTELQLETLVDAITYSNANEDPNTSNRVITITSLTDDGANGGSDDNVSAPALVSTVTVAAVNDAPTDITLTASTISQSATSLGADIGTLGATDADDAGFTYTLVSNGTAANGACGAGNDADNASFQVNTATFETAGIVVGGSYNVCLQVSDGTTTFEKTHTITVTDDVLPTFENATPSLSAVITTGATLNVQLDEIGTAYWVVVADGAGAPSVAQVKLGQDSGGGGATASGNFAIGTASTNVTDAIGGLVANTDYDVYVVAEDDEGTPNVQAAVTGPIDLATPVQPPEITSVTYDASNGKLIVTGLGFDVDGGDDVIVSLLTIHGASGESRVLTTANVERDSVTQFTVDLNGADTVAVNAIFNQDGGSPTGEGGNYYIEATDGFIAATAGADNTGNIITVSNISDPIITGATYNVGSGVLTITGSDFPSFTGVTNDVVTALLSVDGEGGAYGLTGSSVERGSATSITITLDATDQTGLQKLINKNGATSTSGQTYFLDAADNWAAGAGAGAPDISVANVALTASGVPGPSISSATYDSSTDTLVVTGQNMLKKTGGINDIDISTLTLTGEAGGTYQLSTSTDVELTDSTSFSLTLIGGDIAAVENLLHINGTTSDSGQTYNLAAAEDWNTGADAAVNIADGAAPVTVSGYPVPNITSATYDANTGDLVVTGANFESKVGGVNDIDVSLLTFTGQGGATYTLTAVDDVERDGGSPTTQFNVTLSGADKIAVDNILNKNGAASADAITYNLAAGDDFNASVLQGNTSDATATIAVSSVAPAVTVPASTIDVNAATQAVSGTFTTNGTTISLFLDTGNDGTPDGGALGTDNVAGGTWSITATLADDTVFDYLVVADQGGGNESLYMDVPTITEDSTVPVGYSAVIDAAIGVGNDTALSFTFSGAEVGTTYDYTITTDGGAGTAVGTGTIATATDKITNVNVSAVQDGTLTLSVTLTDDASNIGVAATDTENKDTFVPTPANVPPTAGNDSATTVEGTPVVISVLTNDSDSDGALATNSVVPTTPANGSTSVNTSTGAITYTPSETFVGADSFTYTVRDNQGGVSNSATVSVSVTAAEVVNAAPIAVADTANTTENTSVAITVLGNDSDTDGSLALNSVAVVTSPANGSVSIDTTTGVITYTPSDAFVGDDSFTYTVSDDEGAISDPATVSVSVTAEPVVEVPIVPTVSIDPRQVNITTNRLAFSIADAGIDSGYQFTLTSAGGGSVSGSGLVNDAGLVSDVNIEDLGDGEWTLAVSITDALGNKIILEEVSYTMPSGELDAAGLYTVITLSQLQSLGLAGVDDSTSNCDCRKNRSGSLVLLSGRHRFAWTAEPAILDVWPLVSFGLSKTVSEGEDSTVDFFLSGPAPEYPYSVAYITSGTADSADHSLTDGNVTFTAVAAEAQTVGFSTTGEDGSESDETIIVAFSDGSINAGVQNSQTIAIREGNVAPSVSLVATQSGSQGLIFSNTVGSSSIIVQSSVTDGNGEDVHVYSWAQSGLTDTDSSDTSFTFDPSGLTAGSYELSLTVTDNGAPQEADSALIYIVLKDALPVLTSSADSDNDGLTDAEEGLADTDSDGVPDYLDPPLPAHILPTVASEPDIYLVECDPSADCRLGSFAIQGENSGVALSEEDQEALLDDDEGHTTSGAVFDFAGALPEVGDSLRIVIPLRSAIPAKAVYRKYTVENGWTDFVIGLNNNYYSTEGDEGLCPPPGDDLWVEGLTEGDLCLQLEIEDGGPNDSDGEANGTVVDPGAIAVPDADVIPVPEQHAPVAVDDDASVSMNGSVIIDVLSNDSDEDGDTLSLQMVSVDSGTVSIEPSEEVLYVPAAGFFGNALITYTVEDGAGGSDTANVFVSVTKQYKSSGKGGGMGWPMIALLLLSALRKYRPRRSSLPMVIMSGGLAALLPAPESHAADWSAISDKGFVELEVFTLEGSQGRSDFTGDMMKQGIDTEVFGYDVTRTGYQVSLGYTYNSYATLLVGYTDLGDVNVDFETAAVDQNAVGTALEKSHPLTGDGLSMTYRYRHNVMNDISVIADVGVLFWSSDIDTSGSNASPKIDDGIDPMLALGIEYAVSANAAVGLKYRYQRLDDQSASGFGLLVRGSF